MNMNPKGFVNLIVIGIVLTVVFGVGGYFVLVRRPGIPSGTQQSISTSTTIPPPVQAKPPQQTSSQTPTPATDKTGDWKTYGNNNGGFEFKYPPIFALRNGDHPDFPHGSFLKAHGGVNVSAPITVVTILPQNVYSGTNFISAWLAVAYDPVIANTVDCRDLEQNNNIRQLSQTQTINGISWYKDIVGGTAAGTLFENRAYHVLHDEICYEVVLNLATTNMGNYESGTVKAVNETEIWNKLTDIFTTFRFTKNTSSEELKSGISGTVLIGPQCPAVSSGNNQCGDRPYQDTFLIMKADRKTEVARFTSNVAGKFNVAVPPGEYIIVYPSEKILPSCSDKPAKIEAGKFAEITIQCDSGIR